MKTMRHIISAYFAILFGCISVFAQEKVSPSIEVDKTAHNFGQIIHKSGPVSCSFTFKNTGSKPVAIYNVVSTCGCTNVDWTKEPIMPGKTGKVSVTYSNDEGAYPFDKTLTTYTSDTQKPILLKIRGISVDTEKPLTEIYPIAYGPLSFRESLLKCGNLEQGKQKSEVVLVANTSKKPITVTFDDTDKNLSLNVSPNPIPAESTAELTYTVTADRSIWGKNTYYTTPLINGKAYTSTEGKTKIGIWAFTKENFSHLSKDERTNGPRPTFKEGTYSFGNMKRGETIHAEFTFKNDGKQCFCVYKVNTDAKRWSHSTIPAAMPGEEVTFRVHIETDKMPAGEHLTIVTLTTNSPLRPIVNLFIAGYLE